MSAASDDRSQTQTPRVVRIALIVGIGLICAGAAYLMLSRGNAMLLDLSTAAARILCL
jgi:hypothetical protein